MMQPVTELLEDEDTEGDDSELETDSLTGSTHRKGKRKTKDAGDDFYKALTSQMRTSNDECATFGNLITIKMRNNVPQEQRSAAMTSLLMKLQEFEINET